MKTKKTTRTMEITLEKSELQIVVKHRRKVFGLCLKCGEKRGFLPPEEIADVSPRSIYKLIERQKVFFTELNGGLLLVCFGCVEREKEKAETRP